MTAAHIRTSVVIALLAIAPLGIAACGSGDGASSAASGETTAQAAVEAVSVQQASSALADEGAVMVDVREPDEIATVAVPGTLNIPLGQLEQRAGEVPTGQRVLVLCNSGNRSQEGAAILRAAGYDAVSVEGGIVAWQEAGLPTA